MVTPRRRRSSIAAVPRNKHNVRTCTDSTREYIQSDSWSAILPGVFSSHWQRRRRDILGAARLSENPQDGFSVVRMTTPPGTHPTPYTSTKQRRSYEMEPD